MYLVLSYVSSSVRYFGYEHSAPFGFGCRCGAQLLRQDFQPARIAAAAAAVEWPDHDVSLLLSAGACLVGDIEESHIFRSAHVTAELSLDGLLASSRESIQAVLKRNPPPPAQATVIWKKTCDEEAAGYMRGPFYAG